MLPKEMTLDFTPGALTKGDRRAATAAELEEFNFDTSYGKQALKQMYSSIMTVCWRAFLHNHNHLLMNVPNGVLLLRSQCLIHHGC